MLYGIDVAKWQGVIDWSKVNKSFAIIKVTDKSNRPESQFEYNITGAVNNGIAVGVYRYVYALNVGMGVDEANAIVKALNGRKLALGVWLDMEDYSIRNIGKGRLTDIINTEAKILQKAGYNVGIYCNKDWYYNVLDYKYLKDLYPFWIARYSAHDDGNEPSLALCPSAYGVAWQYSSKGKVDGINGNVDMDVLFCPIDDIYKPTAPKPVLKMKDYGVSVALLQRCLNWFGADLVVDGSFGPKTHDAVLAYQRKVFDDPAEYDGIYGGRTYRKMKEML